MNEKTLISYRVLEVKRDASREDIRIAHRQLVKVWHPDRFQNDAILLAKAQEKLKEINLAYEAILHYLDEPQLSSERTEHPRQDGQSQARESAHIQFKQGADAYNRGDLNKALDCFLKAANQGMPDAQYWVGKVYYHHRRFLPLMGKKHFEECLSWFTKAAEQGHAEAQYMVGDFHHGGMGTPYNSTEAKKWYALAAKQGHRKAKQRLTWYGFLWGYYE